MEEDWEDGEGVVASSLISGSSSGEHNICKAVIHIRTSISTLFFSGKDCFISISSTITLDIVEPLKRDTETNIWDCFLGGASLTFIKSGSSGNLLK